MDTYGEIKRKLRNIAAGKALIYEGEVKSVSGSTCTVDIGGVELSDVHLTSLPDETDILITPKVGSHVVLGTEVNYSQNGGSRKISLGRRLS